MSNKFEDLINAAKVSELLHKKELEEKNIEALNFVIKEIQTHMKNNSLRNLVEERSLTSPQNVSALKILDKQHKDYLLESSQLF